MVDDKPELGYEDVINIGIPEIFEDSTRTHLNACSTDLKPQRKGFHYVGVL